LACGQADGDRPLNERYSAEEIAYFKEIAFGVDFQSRMNAPEWTPDKEYIIKWEEDVEVVVWGFVTPEDYAEIDRILAELDELIPSLSISRIEDVDLGDLNVGIVPLDEFAEYAPTEFVIGDELRGDGTVAEIDGVIDWAQVLVDWDRPYEERRSILREEITQTLGLVNDSWSYPDSTFYQGVENRRTEFSDLDKALIRLLYEDEIKPEMTLEDLEALGL